MLPFCILADLVDLEVRIVGQARIQTVAKVARATVRFFPPRIFRGSPLLDTALRIFRKYILVI